MTALFNIVIQKVITFVQNLWSQIFGGWNYAVIFGWLPSDILAAVNIIIVVLFCLAMWKLLMQIIPH